MILLGIDFGDARTGVARVNTDYPIVMPLCTVRETGLETTAQKVALLAKTEQAQKLVVGLPRHMDGGEGGRAERTRLFGQTLAQLTGLEIVYFDERLSSRYAHSIMNQTNTRGKKRKDSVDALAATVILQNYIDALTANP